MFTFNELCEEMITQYGPHTRILGYVVTPPKSENTPEKVDCLLELRKFNDNLKSNNGGSFSVNGYVVVQYQPFTLASGCKNVKRSNQHGFFKEQKSQSYFASRCLFLQTIERT